MSIICVCVKKACIAGDGSQLNTYVCLKLQNVKSTTIAVKGCVPSWEQDFMFETQTLKTGLTAELWNKGVFWDRMLGCVWIPLAGVKESAKEGLGRWISLDSEYVIHRGVIVGTRDRTDHQLLLDIRMEHGFGVDQHHIQMHLARLQNAKQDEDCLSDQDSDYTSDYNLPMRHQHNLPAFQYRSELLQRAAVGNNAPNAGAVVIATASAGGAAHAAEYMDDSEPLSYNSRPAGSRHRRLADGYAQRGYIQEPGDRMDELSSDGYDRRQQFMSFYYSSSEDEQYRPYPSFPAPPSPHPPPPPPPLSRYRGRRAMVAHEESASGDEALSSLLMEERGGGDQYGSYSSLYDRHQKNAYSERYDEYRHGVLSPSSSSCGRSPGYTRRLLQPSPQDSMSDFAITSVSRHPHHHPHPFIASSLDDGTSSPQHHPPPPLSSSRGASPQPYTQAFASPPPLTSDRHLLHHRRTRRSQRQPHRPASPLDSEQHQEDLHRSDSFYENDHHRRPLAVMAAPQPLHHRAANGAFNYGHQQQHQPGPGSSFSSSFEDDLRVTPSIGGAGSVYGRGDRATTVARHLPAFPEDPLVSPPLTLSDIDSQRGRSQHQLQQHQQQPPTDSASASVASSLASARSRNLRGDHRRQRQWLRQQQQQQQQQPEQLQGDEPPDVGQSFSDASGSYEQTLQSAGTVVVAGAGSAVSPRPPPIAHLGGQSAVVDEYEDELGYREMEGSLAGEERLASEGREEEIVTPTAGDLGEEAEEGERLRLPLGRDGEDGFLGESGETADADYVVDDGELVGEDGILRPMEAAELGEEEMEGEYIDEGEVMHEGEGEGEYFDEEEEAEEEADEQQLSFDRGPPPPPPLPPMDDSEDRHEEAADVEEGEAYGDSEAGYFYHGDGEEGEAVEEEEAWRREQQHQR